MAQAQKWGALLAKHGAEISIVPLLELIAVTRAEQIQAIKNIVLDFDCYQKAIFVSQNAVEFGWRWLEDYWPQLPLGVDYFAVGETTARELQGRGVAVSALTAVETGAMNSESLLCAAELHNLAGQKIVIFRGCGGRGHMGEILRSRGARVDYCELYERHLPEAAREQWTAAFKGEDVWQKQHIIALHSGESLQHYCELLDQLAALPETQKLAVKIRDLPLLLPGERVTQLAQAAGFSKTITAVNATDPSMLEALSHPLTSQG